jgi:hypothetical protein
MFSDHNRIKLAVDNNILLEKIYKYLEIKQYISK